MSNRSPVWNKQERWTFSPEGSRQKSKLLRKEAEVVLSCHLRVYFLFIFIFLASGKKTSFDSRLLLWFLSTRKTWKVFCNENWHRTMLVICAPKETETAVLFSSRQTRPSLLYTSLVAGHEPRKRQSQLYFHWFAIPKDANGASKMCLVSSSRRE